jgi:hypothetical protein
MKAKRFKQETIINLYEKTEQGLELTDSALVKGLISLGEIGGKVSIDRTACGNRDYKISEVKTLVSEPSFLILKPENELLRKLFCGKRIIQKVYELYPLPDPKHTT